MSEEKKLWTVVYYRTDGRTIETEVEAVNESEINDYLFETDYYFLRVIDAY